MSVLTSIENFFHKLFTSDKSKQVLHTISEIAVIAAPIVEQIQQIVPNKTVAQVLVAYDHFGVPLTTAINANDPNGVGNALQNLAVAELKRVLPPDKANIAMNLIVSAVNMAVSAMKANKAAA